MIARNRTSVRNDQNGIFSIAKKCINFQNLPKLFLILKTVRFIKPGTRAVFQDGVEIRKQNADDV